jgi:hypothetical protein
MALLSLQSGKRERSQYRDNAGRGKHPPIFAVIGIMPVNQFMAVSPNCQ